MAYAQRNRCKWEVVLNYRSLLKFSAWTVREEFSFGGRLDASLRHAKAASSSLESCVAANLSSTASAWGSPGEVAMSEV